MAQKSGDTTHGGNVLVAYAQLAAAQKQWPRAARLCGATDALREGGAVALSPEQSSAHDALVPAARTALDAAAFADLWAQGRAMTWERAIAYALEPDAADETGTEAVAVGANATEAEAMEAERA